MKYAAAKSLQLCPTLWDLIDSSPPGSPIPGILQARTLEWFAIFFSNAWKWKVKSESEAAQSCPTLSDPMDCSLPGSSVHGIFQARILEWVAISFSRRSSQPRDWTRVSCIAGRRFTIWATKEVPIINMTHREKEAIKCWRPLPVSLCYYRHSPHIPVVIAMLSPSPWPEWACEP